MNLSEPGDGTSPPPSGLAYVWVAGILAFLTSAPALFTRGLIGDDWTSYYVFWTEGPSGFVHWMREVAHVGYSIPMLLFSYLGRDTPNVWARIIGLTCHCLNGVLLYRILSQSPHTRRIAALTSAFFLLTPFYVIRLTLNAAYDFFLVFYLMSYVAMNSSSRYLRWLAPLSLFFSLSLETLIALEPFRLLLASRSEQSWWTWFTKLVPFGLTVVLVVALRITILGKSGHYAGQYAPVNDFAVTMAALSRHLDAFPAGLSYAFNHGIRFLGYTASAIVLFVSVTGSVFLGTRTFRTPWLLKSSAVAKNTALLILTGALVILLGALPYALAGVYGDVTRAESRLLFPSQFGILLLLAITTQCFPTPRLRAGIAGGAIAVFALSMAHDAKWLLYDGLVTSDLLRQTRAALLVDPTPKVVKLKISDSGLLFFRNRCLGAPDMNSAQTLLRDDQTPPSYIYTDTCGDFTNPNIVPRGYCPVSYLDDHRCPPHRETWLYTAAPGIPLLDDIGMIELLSAVIDRSSSATDGRGKLVKLTDELQSPIGRAEFRPPCHRTAVQALLWLLALPVSSCENIRSGG
ncbi:MAG: hypothetical protein KGI99_11320 [Bradyrhizobium sp.]|nr:hypothetical protein [Pseudomonadota bacterium]MDE2067782.1 hypothetical protein [Bradyrhizobium sp.]